MSIGRLSVSYYEVYTQTRVAVNNKLRMAAQIGMINQMRTFVYVVSQRQSVVNKCTHYIVVYRASLINQSPKFSARRQFYENIWETIVLVFWSSCACIQG